MTIVQLIIDSGTDQNQWFKETFDVGFLPLTIVLDGQPYLDKKEINQRELHEALAAGKMPSTSQPSPGQVKELLENYRINGDQVIIVSIWEKLSGTYQSIKSVVDEYKETYPEFDLALVDSQSGSVGGTIIAIQVAEMIDAGYTFEEIVAQAKWSANHHSIYLTVEDLKWLVKGGRLSKTAGFIGSALKVKPLLTVNQEEIYSDSVVRGKSRIYTKMVQRIKEDTESFPNQLICISHVGEEANAKRVEELVKEEIPGAETMIFEFGAVLAAHIGLGGVAIAALTEKPEVYIMPEF